MGKRIKLSMEKPLTIKQTEAIMSDIKTDLDRNGYVFLPDSNVWRSSSHDSINYTDGIEIERRIKDIIAVSTDLSTLSDELRKHCTDWPTNYHLSAHRANLLRPLARELRGNVLEIGAGCGAITRYLGEQNVNVLALEGSLTRAEIARLRTRDQKNVEVIAENFSYYRSDIKFDYITLIGVLEYAASFMNDDNPVHTMLERAYQHLKPTGRLIIAIENQLGLKYFAGAPEDHIGVPMYGIEGRYSAREPQTFGRQVLSDYLKRAGFTKILFFSPLPDYKLPVAIVSEAAFETKDFDAASLASQTIRYDLQLPSKLNFSIEKAWSIVTRNGLAIDLANSFLVVADASIPNVASRPALAWYYSTSRRKAFCKEAEFYRSENGKIYVKRRKLAEQEALDIKAIYNLAFKFSEVSTYHHGTRLVDELIDVTSNPGWPLHDVVKFFKKYIESVILITQHNASQVNNMNGLVYKNYRIDGRYIDLVPQNIIIDADMRPQLIDDEWHFHDDITIGYLVFRSIQNLYNTSIIAPMGRDFVNISANELITQTMKCLGWSLDDGCLNEYMNTEKRFQEVVHGTYGQAVSIC